MVTKTTKTTKTTKQKKVVILYSGGMDSFIMYHMAKVENPNAEIVPIFFDYGHPANKAEKAALPDFVEVRSVDWLNLPGQEQLTREDTPYDVPMFIPGRNLVFSVLAACHELPSEIWLGALVDEIDNPAGTDKNKKFLDETGKLLSYVLSPWQNDIKLVTPLANKGFDKLAATKWALANGLTKEDLISTTSCYHEEPKEDVAIQPCGNCKQCLKRFVTFGVLGFDELDQMKQHPMTAPVTRQWIINKTEDLLTTGWVYPGTSDLDMPYIAKYVNENIEMFKDDNEFMNTIKTIKENI